MNTNRNDLFQSTHLDIESGQSSQLSQYGQSMQNVLQNECSSMPYFSGNIDEKFPMLSYTEVEANLRFLSDIKEGEKIMIDSDRKTMMVDQRYFFQSIRRGMFNDSRFRTLLFTQHMIDNTKRYCAGAVHNIKQDIDYKDNMQKLLKLQGLLRTAGDGLGRLLITYSDDKQSKAKIGTYIDTIRVFCDQDMEQVVAHR
jgi:hypothetical protein